MNTQCAEKEKHTLKNQVTNLQKILYGTVSLLHDPVVAALKDMLKEYILVVFMNRKVMNVQLLLQD